MPFEFTYEIEGEGDVVDVPAPPAGLAATATARLLAFVRNTQFSALMSVFGQRTQDLVDFATSVQEAFDLETAVGAQLDVLGGILQMPRHGYADNRYRVLLQIQVELILSSTTTTPTILRVVELFTGYNPVSYSENYPMGFTVGAVLDDPADAPLLVQLINKAKAAAYNATVNVSDVDGLVLDYTEDDPVDDDEANFILSYTEDDDVPDSGTLGYEFTT